MHSKIHFDFIKNRNVFFVTSAVIVLVGLVMLIATAISDRVDFLNYGVDFSAGTTIDLNLGQVAGREDIDRIFADVGNVPSVITMGGDSDRLSARYAHTLDDEAVRPIIAAFTEEYGAQVSSEVNTVSPDMATEMGTMAIFALLISSLAISVYVTIRFEWRFALSAIVTILYDGVFVVILFAIFRLEVDLPFVAAVLTAVGYSINDKIVILDRIRENLRFAKIRKDQDLADLVNQSIWQTMSRSINTLITILFAAVSLFIFGSEAIRLFALAMIFGLLSGIYSSICLATPLWYLLRRKTVGVKKPAANAV